MSSRDRSFTERQCILAQDSRKIKDFLANANITTFAMVQDILSDLNKINTLKFKHVPAKYKTRNIGLKSTHDTSNGFEDYRDADLCGERIDESMTSRSISCHAVKNRDTDLWGERIVDLPSTDYRPPLKDHHPTRLSVTRGEVTANKIDPTYGYGEVIMTTFYSVETCPTHMKGEYYSLHILCAPSPIKKFF